LAKNILEKHQAQEQIGHPMADGKDFFLSFSSRSAPAARFRLICFPYAGGGASIFREWALDLPADIAITAIQLPGREDRLRERPYTDLDNVVQELAAALPRYSPQPFAFFGHSMGALVSFELARRLSIAGGVQPTHLFVSGHRAPSLPDRDTPIHRLPDSAFIEELRKLNGTPKEILENTEIMRVVLPAIRADFQVCETYVYENREPLPCPITALGGLQDRKVRNQDLPAWRNETRSSFRLRMFPGDHYFLRSCRVPILRSILEDLNNA
jgi:medium-chain acyl-[acyl-carrier-protein] hydrolase